MRKVYDADSYIDALIARGWLQDAGIATHFAGEHLGGAVGELPAFGLYSLWVEDDQVGRAQAVLAELAAQRAGDGDEEAAAKSDEDLVDPDGRLRA
jgi:hypothetical protein